MHDTSPAPRPHDPRSSGLRPHARRAAILVALLGLALGACRGQKTGPEEALRAFLADMRSGQAGRADAAWEALTESSRKALLQRHEALDRAAGKTSEPKPAKILFDELDLMPLNQPESIAVVSPPGAEVTLRVTVKDGRSADVRLVREGGTWKVDLLGSLKPAPPLPLRGPAEGKPEHREETDTATTP